jgi:Zn-finger nucleic acid-binding protein
MNCPACDRELAHLDAGNGVFLDVCQGGCGGVWFDNFELQKFDEAHEMPGSPVFAVEPAEGPAPAAPTGGAVRRTALADGPKRLCPRCPGQKMRRYFFSAKRQIEVDECPSCGGDWLDNDELEKIRGEFATAEAREDAAKAMFGQLFDARIAEARAESQARVKRAEEFNRKFKAVFGMRGWR